MENITPTERKAVLHMKIWKTGKTKHSRSDEGDPAGCDPIQSNWSEETKLKSQSSLLGTLHLTLKCALHQNKNMFFNHVSKSAFFLGK